MPTRLKINTSLLEHYPELLGARILIEDEYGCLVEYNDYKALLDKLKVLQNQIDKFELSKIRYQNLGNVKSEVKDIDEENKSLEDVVQIAYDYDAVEVEYTTAIDDVVINTKIRLR